MAWNIQGIFSNGNINPVSNMVGSIMPIIDISIAVCCESVMLEISKPNDRQVMIKRMLSAKSSTRLPLISTRSEEHTSELQSIMRISYAVFCLNKKKIINTI